MIEIKNVSKHYNNICAVNHVSLKIPKGMYCLLGSNGAGKTTLLQMMAGIMKPDEGEILIDGKNCYENVRCKQNVFYLPDTPYYFPNSTMEEMAEFYKRQYPSMCPEDAAYLAEQLNLDIKCPLRTFSKGMKRQAFLILALCANTKYLLCDEVFDGLDPVVTKVMKNIFKKEMEIRKFTIVAVSHKLEEIQDIYQNVGILHQGGVITGEQLGRQGEDIFKFQFVRSRDIFWDKQKAYLEKTLDLVLCHKDDWFITLIACGERNKIRRTIETLNPQFLEEIPMTMEEIFILGMEAVGYDIRKVLS